MIAGADHDPGGAGAWHDGRRPPAGHAQPSGHHRCPSHGHLPHCTQGSLPLGCILLADFLFDFVDGFT